MIAESEKAYSQFADEFTPDSFSEDIHKQIFNHICTYYKEGKDGRCADFLMKSMQGNEKELSTVLMAVQNVENEMQAAHDFAEVLKNEIFNEKLQKAQSEGDIALISELLKSKKQKA